MTVTFGARTKTAKKDGTEGTLFFANHAAAKALSDMGYFDYDKLRSPHPLSTLSVSLTLNGEARTVDFGKVSVQHGTGCSCM